MCLPYYSWAGYVFHKSIAPSVGLCSDFSPLQHSVFRWESLMLALFLIWCNLHAKGIRSITLTLTHARRQVRTLTETAVAVVHHEIGSQGSGGEVVHAAGPVRHVPHHDGIRLREPWV